MLEGGRITGVGIGLPVPDAATRLDADGLIVDPGADQRPHAWT